MKTLLPPLPPSRPGVTARVGDPRLLFPRGLAFVTLDLERRLLVLAGEDITVTRDLGRYVEAPGGAGTSTPPYRLVQLTQGDLLLVDGDTLGRYDPRSGKDRLRAVKLVGAIAAAIDAEHRVVAVAERKGKLRVFGAAKLERRAEHDLGMDAEHVTLALAPGGELALVVGEDVRVVSTVDGATLWARPRSARVGAVFVDRARVAIVERDGEAAPILRLLDAHTGEVVHETSVGASEAVTSVTRYPLASDGSKLALGLADRVEVWTADGAKKLASIAVDLASFLTFVADALLVVRTCCVHAFDAEGRRLSPVVPSTPVERLEARGGTVLVGETAGALVWRPGEDAVVRLDLPCASLALSPDGERLVARLSDEDEVVIARARDGGARERIAGLRDAQCLAWGGRFIVATSLDEHLHVVDAERCAVVGTIPAPAVPVFRLVISADGGLLACLLYNSAPRLHTLPDGARRPPLAWPKGARPDSLSLARADRELVVGTERGELLRFDTTSGALLGRVRVGRERVQSLAASSDGRFAAVGSTDSEHARIVRLADGKELGKVAAAEGRGVGNLALLDGDRTLVVAQSDGGMFAWRIPDKARAAPLPPTKAVAKSGRSRTDARPALVETPLRAPPPPIGRGLVLFDGDSASLLHAVSLGRLAVPSGRIVVGDPRSLDDARPLARRVPRGLHPVLAVVHEGRYGGEVPAIFVQLADAAVASWEEAGACGTDCASLVVLDAAIAATAYDDTPEGELLSAARQAKGVGGLGAELVGGPRRNALLFATGADGGYPVHVGLDARGKPAALFLQTHWDWANFTAPRLPCGDPPWDDPARIPPWAHRTAAAVGDVLGFSLAPLGAAALLELESLAGVTAPDEVRRYYEAATPGALEAWPARAAPLRALGIAAFPLGDASSEYDAFAVCAGGVTSVRSIDDKGQLSSRWSSPNAWATQAAAECVHDAQRRKKT